MHGGLGLRHIKSSNLVFMMKIRQGLIKRKDDLQARVLRAKYGCGDIQIPRVERKHSNSNLWKGVVKSWAKFTQGLAWNVNDGRIIQFWSDNWLKGMGSLRGLAKCNMMVEDLKKTVIEFTASLGNWNQGLLYAILPKHICLKIASTLPPMEYNKQDCVRWEHSVNGSFSVKSAYNLME